MNRNDQKILQIYLKQYHEHLIERRRYVQANEVMSVLMELRTNKFNLEPNIEIKLRKS